MNENLRMPVGRYPQPYRGQPRPKYPKPKKQVRNLKLENKSRVLVMDILIATMLLAVGIVMYVDRDILNGEILAIIALLVLLFVFLTIAVADGLKSINRFRKGYDSDVSGEAEKENDEETEDSESFAN